MASIRPVFALPVVAIMLFVASCNGAGANRESPTATPGELMALYTRTGSGPYGTEVDVTYAPAAFFRATGQEVPSGVKANRDLVFIYNESVHEGEIPPTSPLVLVSDSGDYVQPNSMALITEGGHHRTTRVVFPQSGRRESMTLLVLRADGSPAPGGELTWVLAGAAGTPARSERLR